jgi:ferredoxin, 2Fe-2S
MVTVTFVAHDGGETVVQGRVGDSVMALAIRAGIDGILAECGGSMMCATCHCYVDPAWQAAVGPRMDGEDDMLESAACAVTDASRLSCQIRLTGALDGLRLHLPETQA